MIGNKKTVQYYYHKTTSNHCRRPSFTLKAVVNDHSLLFYHVVAYESPHSRKPTAPVATTFLNSRGGRLREFRL